MPGTTLTARSLTPGLAALLCLALFCGTAPAQLPQPVLDRVFPLGAQAGSRVELEIVGRELDGVKALHFDHPGLKAEFVAANKFRVAIAPDTPPGTHDVRAVGKFGISSARPFAVSRGLAEVRKVGEPDEPAKAQGVPLNAAVSGLTAGNAADHYHFPARKGQRVTLDCQAYRLDSLLRPVLTLAPAGGRELARGRPYFGQIDPLLDFVVPADGDYVVSVRDLTYAGDLPYRLVISDRPQLEQAAPAAVVHGTSAALTVWGRNLPGGKPDDGFRVNGLPLDRLTLSLVPPGPAATPGGDFIDLPASPALNARLLQVWPAGIADALNPLTLLRAGTPTINEQEPNDSPEKAQALKLPAVVCGRFDRPGDMDCYTFTAKANETVAVDLVCERMGRPGDPLVLVTDAKGAELAAFDDHGNNVNALTQFNRDPAGTFAAPADGSYRLIVRDRNRQGGPRFTYVLRVGRPRPDFYPVVYHETANDPTCPVVRQGGASFCEVCVNRRDGFGGFVTVEAEGLPRGVTCPPVRVGPQVETASVVFLAAADAPEWAGPVRLKAWAEIDGKRVERPAGCVQRRHGGGSSNTATRVCRETCLAVRSRAPYALKIAGGPLKVRAGGALEARVRLERLWPDFKDKVQVSGLNLPPGFELAAVEIPEGKTEAVVKCTVAAEVPPGTYSLTVRGDAQVSFQREPDKPEKVTVRVADPAPPLTVTVAAPAAK
jgi:hypothetical protein